MPWGSWITCEETINGPDVGPGLPGPAEHPARAEARLRLRGAGRRPEQPAADHPGRPLPARGRVVRPGRRDPVPHRGQLRVRLRLLPLHPQEQPHGDRVPRQRGPAPDARDHRPAERPPRGAAAAAARRTASGGSTSTTPTRRSVHARPPATTNDPALVAVGDQGRAQGAALSPGSRARSTTTTSSTSPRPRAAGRRAGRTPTGPTTTTPTASARATARSGPTTAAPRRCRSSTRPRSTTRRRTSRSTSPTTSPPVPPARSSSARTARSTTTSAACPAAVSCGTSR